MTPLCLFGPSFRPRGDTLLFGWRARVTPAAQAALLWPQPVRSWHGHMLWFPAALLRNWSAGKSSSCVVINSFSHYGWWLCNNYVEISTEDCCGWGLNYLFLCSTRPAVGRGSLCYLSELRRGLQAGVGIWCGRRHRPSGCCFLCISLCEAVRALQG